MVRRGSERVMAGRRWVIQEMDEEGNLVDEVVLTSRQADLAYAAVVDEGHATQVAPLSVRQLFNQAEREFLRRHQFRLTEIGVDSGSYWFDLDDARPWRQAFDLAPLHLLEMAVQILTPDSRFPSVRLGWERFFIQTRLKSNFEQLVALAEDLQKRGGCYLARDDHEGRTHYYATKPTGAQLLTELRRKARLFFWSAADGELHAMQDLNH